MNHTSMVRLKELSNISLCLKLKYLLLPVAWIQCTTENLTEMTGSQTVNFCVWICDNYIDLWINI